MLSEIYSTRASNSHVNPKANNIAIHEIKTDSLKKLDNDFFSLCAHYFSYPDFFCP